MSKEAMKLALEALENLIKKTSGQAIYSFMETERRIAMAACVELREALAEQKSGIKQVIELYDSPDQPSQQEPVAWMQEMPTREGETRSVRMTTLKEHATLQWGNPIPLYTSPPQRTWVGLTDEERHACTQSPFTTENYRAIEAKLKEKNK